MVTERYTDELVAEMENFGQWSDGSNTVSISLINTPKVFGNKEKSNFIGFWTFRHNTVTAIPDVILPFGS